MAILHLHLYLPLFDDYSVDDFVNYLRGRKGPVDPTEELKPLPDRFETAGVYLDVRKKLESGTADFKTNLKDPGGVVVYLGHSVLYHKEKRSLGLEPLGHEKVEIAPGELTALFQVSRAKLVVLATCASSTLGLEKLKAGPAVVVTNSGPNLKTWSVDWAHALRAFLLLLIGYGVGTNDQPVVRYGSVMEVGDILKNIQPRATIKEALDAANVVFKDRKTVDRFELAHGEGSTVVFPEKK